MGIQNYVWLSLQIHRGQSQNCRKIYCILPVLIETWPLCFLRIKDSPSANSNTGPYQSPAGHWDTEEITSGRGGGATERLQAHVYNPPVPRAESAFLTRPQFHTYAFTFCQERFWCCELDCNSSTERYAKNFGWLNWLQEPWIKHPLGKKMLSEIYKEKRRIAYVDASHRGTGPDCGKSLPSEE